MSIAEIKKSGGTRADKDFRSNLVTAARTIRDNPESIEKTYRSGRLEKLPGMNGPAYELLVEYIETGTIKLYEELKSEYDESLMEFIRISGFDKRRLFAIYDGLGVKNIEELKEEINSKNIEDISKKISDIMTAAGPGKSRDNGRFYVERLRHSLDYVESIKGLYPRWQIEIFLGEIIESLYKIKDIEKVVVTGSLRRKKPFVKDIDILILPIFNDKFFNSPRSMELIKEIKTLGFVKKFKGSDIRSQSISGRFETVYGVDVEFILSSHNNWAVDLLYTTGSREHIKELEKIAGEKGQIEGGRIKNISFSDSSSGAEEVDFMLDNGSGFEEPIYDRLGLQYIPPELRENTGEIELAAGHMLPVLIKMEDIKGDFHVHSTWSDGIISIDDMIERIKKYNYEYLAISDHSVSNYFGRGLDNKRIEEKMEYVSELKSRFRDFRFLMGSEIDINGAGKFDYPDEIIRKLDIAIGSMHSSFLNSKDENTARAVSAVKNKYIDIIAHPTGVVFGNRAPYLIDIDRLIVAAAGYNKALEINSYYLRMDLNEQNARKASKMGAKLAINTDSHRPNNMDMIRLGVDIARRAGLEKKDVINTLSYKELEEWKKQRMSNIKD
ncbi:MAG: PHP domain-containing protein [Actinomycetota bacterium]|nr:PHP domain-containing protein [Actinomycetota bacterium]